MYIYIFEFDVYILQIEIASFDWILHVDRDLSCTSIYYFHFLMFFRFYLAIITDMNKEPLATFGVLTDVQFADCDNLPASYDSSKLRYYRASLDQVDVAFQYWEKSSDKVQFVLQLGDIIDGRSRECPGGSFSSLRRTLAHFEKHRSIPTFHTVGNHELYNFNRKKLAELFYESVMKFNILPEIFSPENPLKDESTFTNPVLYYKFCPTPFVKCISLDCFDISVLGYDEKHSRYKEAAEILKSKHGHDIFDDWDCDGELTGLDTRFQQMNGAVGEEQLKWLDKELAESEELQQKVIVFGKNFYVYLHFNILYFLQLNQFAHLVC